MVQASFPKAIVTGFSASGVLRRTSALAIQAHHTSGRLRPLGGQNQRRSGLKALRRLCFFGVTGPAGRTGRSLRWQRAGVPPMRLRSVVRWISLGATLVSGVGLQARERPSPEVTGWVSAVIAKIDMAQRPPATERRRRGRRTVVVRVQIAADGFVNRVDVERSSGAPDLDERARELVRAAGPFGPPPVPLLTPAGTTDLSFPLSLER